VAIEWTTDACCTFPSAPMVASITTAPCARSDSARSGNSGLTSLILRGGLMPPAPPTRYGPRDSDPDPDPEPVVPSITPPATEPGLLSVVPSVPPATTVSGAIVDGASIGAGASYAAGRAADSAGGGSDVTGFGSRARDGAGPMPDGGLAATIAGITSDE